MFVFGKATVCLTVLSHGHPGGSCQCPVGCWRRRSHWETRCHGLPYHRWQDGKCWKRELHWHQGYSSPVHARKGPEFAEIPDWGFANIQSAAIVESDFFEILWIMKTWKMNNSCLCVLLNLIYKASFCVFIVFWQGRLTVLKDMNFQNHSKDWSFSDSQWQKPYFSFLVRTSKLGWRIVSELPKFWFAIGLASCRSERNEGEGKRGFAARFCTWLRVCKKKQF